MADPHLIDVDPYFGGFVLETLTIGMYEETRNAIREYVQNGFDSIQRAVNKLNQLEGSAGLIRVIFDPDGDGVRIRDNGAGLGSAVAVRTLTAIGASSKDFATDAGFRGIGRLAGIAFCDTLTFTTKAAGEGVLTEVVFDAKKMRNMMSPEQGSSYTAQKVLKDCVKAQQTDTSADDPSFFEVSLRSFVEAPKEVKSPEEMELFLAQVSPVDYRDDFALAQEIKEFATTAPVPIETVRIVIEQDGKSAKPVLKPYGAKFAVQDVEAKVALSDRKFYLSPTKQWWGWVGRKDVPGSYTDEEVRGIRVRAKNIQIDGTAVVRDIFQRQNKSNGRYQDWFIGELFVDPKAVVPNARRDGFEDTKAWSTIRDEIGRSVCKDAGTWAQEVSNQGQLSLDKLTQRTGRLAEDFESLRRNEFKNSDKTLKVSADMTKLHSEVSRAARNADAATLSSLQSLGARLLDMKAQALGRLVPPTPELDTDRIENEARDAMLAELMAKFEQHLDLPCLNAVRSIVRREFGWPRV